LRRAVRRLPATNRPAGESLLHVALVERAARQAELRELMRLFSVSKFVSRVNAMLTFRARHRDANRLLAESGEQLRDLRRTLRRRHKQFLKKRSSLSFHKFRIAAKGYRYALEACQAVFRIDVQERIRSVETLQDLMGEAHDVELLIDYLRQSRGRADKEDKKLAACIERLIHTFTGEHQKRFALFEDYLKEKRPWMKKVRLQFGKS
jgi:CHAD domain-containing protein